MKEAVLRANQTVEDYSPNDVFICPEESQFYSQCLDKMVLNQCTPFESIIEFGSGDGSPVINSLIKTKFYGSIQGYELNPVACELAQSTIEKYRLKNKYIIHNKCFFNNTSSQANYLIANPPYLPAPDDNLYMPALHGGEDGARITKQLLSVGCENVMLLISAYSNPVETVEYAISQNYQIVDFMISPLSFGYYSCEPKVKNAIAELRKNRKAFYSQNIYLLAGVLFRKKNKSNVDLFEEFIRIMTAF